MEACRQMFEILTVVGCKTDVPCIDGFILTNNSVKIPLDRLRVADNFKIL
jgi:hypothetical protein